MALKHITATAFILLTVVCSHLTNGGYVIVSPDSIRPGLPLVLSVNVDATQPVTLTAWISKDAVNLIQTQIQMSYASSVSDTIELQVPVDADGGSSYRLHVTGSGGVIFSEDKPLTFVAKGFSIYIQTDKAIYKPGQPINYRIFAVNPDLSQRMVNFDVEIKDPLGNLIQQTSYAAPPTGVITEELLMSTQPVLGDWNIAAVSGDVATHQAFTVAEYVLPKFEVTITVPTYITKDDTDLRGRVDATYTFGKPVEGTLLIKISNGGHEIQRNMNIDGTKSFSVPLSEFDILIADTSLKVIALVTESLTGNEQNSTSSTSYHQWPVKVVILEASPKTFKPGLTYTAYIAVTKQDGAPLSKVEMSTPLSVEINGDGNLRHYEIPSSGVVTATIETGTTLSIKAQYNMTDQDTDIINDRKEVDAVYSPSDKFIQIGLATTELKAGDTAAFTLDSTEIPPYIVYMIKSKGKIVAMETLSNLISDRNTLSVDITSDMAPLAKLIVYYIRVDGEVVVDAFNFNVDGAFKNQVNVSFSNDVVEPGDDITVDVSATGGSLVYLLAVDQSVLLLKSGNDITQEKVLKELNTFDGSVDDQVDTYGGGWLAWWCAMPPQGTSASEIFEDSGVIVLTDATIPDSNVYYRDYHYAVGIPDRAYFDFAPAQGGFPGVGVPGIGTEMETAGTLPNTDTDSAVRTEFPETWLWMDTTVGVDGTVSIKTKVPDTITSWIGSAFALSSATGLGVVPTTAKITVFKPFFVTLNLPYSVIRGENLALEILVFNYQTTDITASIKLHKSIDFDNIEFRSSNSVNEDVTEVYVSKDQIVTASIPAGEGVSVSFPIVPKNLKLMDIQVSAQSSTGMDSVIRQLLVEPEGVTRSYTDPELIDLSGASFTKSFPVVLPPTGLVEGSVFVLLSTTGDIMGPTMSGLDELLRMPSGCGEQNMIGFAPDVFIYDYLLNTGQNNEEIKEKALRFMKIGYQRELDYQHKDGSFSAFGDNDPSGSTWLSAFVVKSFVQAQDFIFIDSKLVEKATGWILDQQNVDGSFPEPGKVCHRDMQGGLSGPVTLTAYVLVALQEAKLGKGFSQTTLSRLDSSVNSAGAYLESQFSSFNTDPYVLAITTYALTLSGRPSRDMFLAALEDLAIVEDGLKHWSRPESQSVTKKPNVCCWRAPYGKPPSSEVEMTGYALLTYMARNDVLGGSSISKWLTRQRSEIGGYSSTQDTVVALQALASYAGKLSLERGEVTIEVTATDDPTYQQTITVNSGNALVFQQLEVPVSSGSVDVSASGSGSFLVQFTVSYNVEEVEEEPAFDVTVVVIDNDQNNIQITVCGQYLKDQLSGMSIMDIGIPSGFAVDEDRVKRELMNVATLQKYELQKRSAILYLDEITSDSRTCATIIAYRTNIVSNVKPSPVKVYNYYQPDEELTTFYVSDMLSNSGIRDLCANCGKVISLSAANPTSEPSAAIVHSSVHPLLNIVALILSCFFTGFMLGVNYRV